MSRYVTSVNCVKIDNKGRPRNKAPLFTFSVSWSDGKSDNTLERLYVTLFDFHAFLNCYYAERVLAIAAPERSKLRRMSFQLPAKLKEKYKDDEVQIPPLPEAKKFSRSFLIGTSFEKKKSVVEEYFRKILQLPVHISQGEMVREFFEFADDSDSAPAETSTASYTASHSDCGFYETVGGDVDDDVDDSGDCDGGYASVSETVPFSHNAEAKRTTSTPANSSCTTPELDCKEALYFAVQPYVKRKSGEVNLEQGHTVNVMQRELSGWWFVHVQDTEEQGWAPASCLLPENREQLAELTATGPLGEFQTRCDYESIAPDELSLKKQQKVEVLEACMDGWWKVRCGDKVGLTPATCLEPVTSDTGASKETSVYHQVGPYRKLSPPPRRSLKESVDELYAQVNKMKTTERDTNRAPPPTRPAAAASASTTSRNVECMYSQIEPAVRLSPEDYKSAEDESNPTPTPGTKKLRHSYVNVATKSAAAASVGATSPNAQCLDEEKTRSKSDTTRPAVQLGTDDKKVSVPIKLPNPPNVSASVKPAAARSSVATEKLHVYKLNRSQCEQVLNDGGQERQYIIRESTKAGCPYCLSVLCSDRVHHIPIELTADNRYYIGQYSFESMAQVIVYYSHSALCYTKDDKEVLLGSQFTGGDSIISFPLEQRH